MTPQDRLGELEQQLRAIENAWPLLAGLLQERIDAHTTALINRNDDETRGRIKALKELQELPVTLQQERDGIKAGLADEAPD
jgi:hypothetical protein